MSTTESYYPFTYIYCPSRPTVCTLDKMDSTMESYIYVHYSTVHPILLYYGQDGQVLWNLTVHLHICTLSYIPSHPIVQWTRWTVLWNLSIQSYLPYPTIHPVLLYHGQDGQYYGIQVYSHIYLILLSILSYCTMDRKDSTMASKYPFRLPYPTVHPVLLYHGQDGQYYGIQVSISENQAKFCGRANYNQYYEAKTSSIFCLVELKQVYGTIIDGRGPQ